MNHLCFRNLHNQRLQRLLSFDEIADRLFALSFAANVRVRAKKESVTKTTTTTTAAKDSTRAARADPDTNAKDSGGLAELRRGD